MKKATTPPSSPPAASLFGANLAYCQRLAALAQESQARWAELGRQVWGENASRYQATLAPWRRRAIGRTSRPPWATSRASRGRNA